MPYFAIQVFNKMLRRLLLIPLLLMGACSLVDGHAQVISQQELLQLIEAKADMLILDVRTPGEYSEGHIPGAYSIDHLEIESRIKEIEAYRDKPVVVYCYSGVRAGMVESYLVEHGFTKVQHLEGDWSAWKANGQPTK
jgi:rhodanese-related sulfurtransferase